jgi:hypothetical protein
MHEFDVPGMISNATYHSVSEMVKKSTEMCGCERFPGRSRYEMVIKKTKPIDT